MQKVYFSQAEYLEELADIFHLAIEIAYSLPYGLVI